MKLKLLWVWLVLTYSPFALSDASASSQDYQIHVFELKHRPAELIADGITPFLVPGATAKPFMNQLIIKTSPDNLYELADIVSQLDTPLRQLKISVKQGSTQQGSNRNVTLTGKNTRTEVRLNQYHSHDRSHINQQLRILEGHAAFIRTGERIPVPTYYEHDTYTHEGIVGGIEYEDIDSGFYVVANIRGDHVHLDISPFKELLSQNGGGQIDTHDLQTHVRVKLGEWVEIGGGFQQEVTNQRGTLHSTKERDKSNQSVMLKVEIID